MGGRCDSFAMTETGVKRGYSWGQIGERYSRLWKEDRQKAISFGDPNKSDEACRKVAQLLYDEKQKEKRFELPPLIIFSRPAIEVKTESFVSNFMFQGSPHQIAAQTTAQFIVYEDNYQEVDAQKWIKSLENSTNYKTNCIVEANTTRHSGIFEMAGCFPIQFDENRFGNRHITLSCDFFKKLETPQHVFNIMAKMENNIKKGWDIKAVKAALAINQVDINLCKKIGGPNLKRMLGVRP